MNSYKTLNNNGLLKVVHVWNKCAAFGVYTHIERGDLMREATHREAANRDADRDAVLLARLQAGDDRALGDLADIYGGKIFQLAFRYLRNKEDAEEITQDVLFKVYRKVGAFRGDAALSSWIYRITFNTAMSRLRTAKYQRTQTEELTLTAHDGDETGSSSYDVADWSDMADEQVLRSELRKRVFAAILALPAIYRAPVMLRDIQGMSTEEASERLRVKDQTLKSRLHRGRLILRRQLADFAGGLTLHHAAAAGAEAGSDPPALKRHRILERYSIPRAQRGFLDRGNPLWSESNRQCRRAVTAAVAVVGRDEGRDAASRRPDHSLRWPRWPRPRARTGRAATDDPRATRRGVARTASSTRVTANPPIVTSSQGTTTCAGGTPSTANATSAGDPLVSSATMARTALASASGADPKIVDRLSPSARTPRSTSSRCADPAHSTIGDSASLRIRPIIVSPSSPCHSPAPARSASTNTIDPAAETMSCAPDTRVENDSMGAACMMSSALPVAIWPLSSTRQMVRTMSRRARWCASAPPSSPAPMMATSGIGGLL